jgi:hypothetical protein
MRTQHIFLGLAGLMLSLLCAWHVVGADQTSAVLAPATERFAHTAGRIWFTAEEIAVDLVDSVAARCCALRRSFGTAAEQPLPNSTTQLDDVVEADPADQS